MARFIEIEYFRGRKITINVDSIQSIKDITEESTYGKTRILLNNDIVQTNLEYSKVVELIKQKRKDSAYGSNK